MSPQRNLSIDDIENLIYAIYKVTSIDFKSISRKKNIVLARWVSWVVISEYLGLSSVSIGNLHNRDHTTVLHGMRQVKKTHGIDILRFKEMLVDKYRDNVWINNSLNSREKIVPVISTEINAQKWITHKGK